MSTVAIKERPILFSGPMVRAILDGRKRMTRRVIDCPPDTKRIYWAENEETVPSGKYTGWVVECGAPLLLPRACPYGGPGDWLWVRETFTIQDNRESNHEPPFSDGRPIKHHCDDGWGQWWEQAHYRATDPEPSLCCEDDGCRQCEENGEGPHWRPSIHMPRWASRLTLEVVSVRVERVQEIDEADARAEGVEFEGNGYDGRPFWKNYERSKTRLSWPTARESFVSIWDSINGKRDGRSWAGNPWVWVVEFALIAEARKMGGG